MTYDIFGLRHRGAVYDHAMAERVRGMSSPVRCACGQVYDLGKVEVTARYLDCSVWKAPCCKRVADDRGPGWSSVRHYTELDRNGREVQR